MLRVVFGNEMTVHYKNVSVIRLVAEMNGIVGVVQCVIDGSLKLYRIVWCNGEITVEYKSLEELAESNVQNGGVVIKIYEI